ncbi:MAG: hypothetical protein WDM85_03415 [Caulobacteraceae bacterium]
MKGVRAPISTRNVAAAVGRQLARVSTTSSSTPSSPCRSATPFFPTHSEFGRLMLSLFTFGGRLRRRPVGAIVIGRFADRAGRKARDDVVVQPDGRGPARLCLRAELPSDRRLGAHPGGELPAGAGIRLGGEVGPTTAYLIEARR